MSVIRLEHGSGGSLSRELVEHTIYPRLKNSQYTALTDGTIIPVDGTPVFTTDTYVVDPPFFPGGDIGTLAVFGTCNDLAVSGARPQYLSLGFILEEGFPLSDLERVLDSLNAAAAEAGVAIVTGDTKVVPKGKGGGIYINSSGVGIRQGEAELGTQNISLGDKIVVSSPVGEHGIAVLASREKLSVAKNLSSDCRPLYPACRTLLQFGSAVRFMRDATRGGLAAVFNEAVTGLPVGFRVEEEAVPVKETVRTVSEILGLNPFEVANEGVLVAVVDGALAEEITSELRSVEGCGEAAVVGEVVEGPSGRVLLSTVIGGSRVLDFPRGLLLPRIC
jgi:hydrogenase expression/formation protein HypE